MTESFDFNIIVVGSINTDYMVRSTRFPKPGETLAGESFLEAPGGKGANQAVAAARLDGRVALVARAGAQPGDDVLIQRVRSEGIDTRFIVRDPDAATGVALIVVDRLGQKQIVAWPGANDRLSVDDIRAAAAAIRSARVLLVQLEIPIAPVIEATRIAHEAGVTVVLDPAPPTRLPDEFLAMVDVIRPNAREAEMLTGVEVHNRVSARTAAHMLIDRGVKAVAVQAGDEGNLLVWSSGELWLPKIDIDSVDATGAGDAFAAALGVALAEGHSWAEAGPFANAAAALATTAFGAQMGLPNRAAVNDLLGSLA
jgi:ribokinase